MDIQGAARAIPGPEQIEAIPETPEARFPASGCPLAGLEGNGRPWDLPGISPPEEGKPRRRGV